ncbi:hypothetical protein LWE61_17450 [Sphingobium sufflavum]|uniref:hypothetical protein n=1 Tax=Sphingobium sufflavum TaxID=1129547 RepID=UPI001F3C4083|nr:hypothetical protein [Sphingobium sufflavum]MCE7798326.1 hypothetical protein [Sphingobium sufflavum]
MKPSHFLIIAILLLAACDKPAERQGNDADAMAGNELRDKAPTPAPAPANDFSPEKVANNADGLTAAEKAIPAGYQGRWGLVPGDCGPDASIAKGLMVVDGQQLRFYESVGKPAVVTNPTPNRMEGRFSFTGEGMEWSKDMVLTLEGNGDRLVRTESDPSARYAYRRCAG